MLNRATIDVNLAPPSLRYAPNGTAGPADLDLISAGLDRSRVAAMLCHEDAPTTGHLWTPRELSLGAC
jgi:hypothetical protein